jgi:UDP-glucose 6-dehydrogenase
LTGAVALVVATEWPEFQKLRPEDFIKNMKQPILIDGRRIYDPQVFGEKMKYVALGLGQPI